jgi:hypothetical protein
LQVFALLKSHYVPYPKLTGPSLCWWGSLFLECCSTFISVFWNTFSPLKQGKLFPFVFGPSLSGIIPFSLSSDQDWLDLFSYSQHMIQNGRMILDRMNEWKGISCRTHLFIFTIILNLIIFPSPSVPLED